MSYLKFKATHIFDGYSLHDNVVLVTKENGTVESLVDIADAGEDIKEYNGILTPGFVNAHCHVELSHLKNTIPEHTGLVDFVQHVMKNRFADSDTINSAIETGVQEMYDNGIVAVGDICNTDASVYAKQNSTLHWHNFIEVSGFDDSLAAARFDASNRILTSFCEQLPQYKSSLVPHSPYSVSEQLFKLINDKKNQLLSIHNQETSAEDVLYQSGQGDLIRLYENFNINYSSFAPLGKSSLQTYLAYFTHQQPVILVHNTFTAEDDIRFAKAHAADVFFCLCINANLYIEQALPPVELLRKEQCNIIVGTDSLASNWQLSVLSELITISQQFNYTVPLAELLRWATINGAKALQMQDAIGSFEKGKIPGVVLLSGIEDGKLTKDSTAKRLL